MKASKEVGSSNDAVCSVLARMHRVRKEVTNALRGLRGDVVVQVLESDGQLLRFTEPFRFVE
jgi:hypothetical protein